MINVLNKTEQKNLKNCKKEKTKHWN